jgi:hypothetical protein
MPSVGPSSFDRSAAAGVSDERPAARPPEQLRERLLGNAQPVPFTGATAASRRDSTPRSPN